MTRILFFVWFRLIIFMGSVAPKTLYHIKYTCLFLEKFRNYGRKINKDEGKLPRNQMCNVLAVHLPITIYKF